MWEEMKGNGDFGKSMQNISAEELHQIEGDEKLAERIQDEWHDDLKCTEHLYKVMAS